LAIVPLRDIGKLGVLTDIDPYDLPSTAFNFAKNVRFENNRVERGSVFRTVTGLKADPRLLVGYSDKNTNPQLVTMYADGTLGQWNGTTETDVTPTGFTPSVLDVPTTYAIVNNVVFLNRPDHIPWFRSKDGLAQFTPLPTSAGNWVSTTTAKAIASIKGVVVALNLTKNGSQYPNNVLWSNFVPLDQAPDWDITVATFPSSSAGENTLADMKAPIVGGLALKENLMIYGQDETWYMQYVGGNDMFKFDRVFQKGMLNPNCVVEAEGIHYVFGPNDIWMHDGVTQKTLAQSKVRQFIYDGMRKFNQNSFFVAHNQAQTEILFCYVSDDKYVRFPSKASNGCNRAAIYNYAADTWYFADIPYLTASTKLIVNKSVAFDSDSLSFDNHGGSFSASQNETKEQFVTGGNANATYGLTNSLRTFSRYSAATTAFPLDASASSSAFLYREGLDLDELKAELEGYKLCSSIYPQIRLDPSAAPLVFTVGACDHPNASPIWGNTQTYDKTYTKLDHNIAGRFLAYKIEQTDLKPFSITGFDIDLTILGNR
jgi:hypothetical protein